jgi:hypothetical protein
MTNLNVLEAIRFYINQLIDDSGQSMKVLIMDKETVCETKYFYILLII